MTQHKNTQNNNTKNMTLGINGTIQNTTAWFAECCCAVCHICYCYAECHYAECPSAQFLGKCYPVEYSTHLATLP